MALLPCCDRKVAMPADEPGEGLRDKDQGALQISGLWSLAGETTLAWLEQCRAYPTLELTHLWGLAIAPG